MVKWVVDGDTICLEENRIVRYIGIDAPETAHKDRPAQFLADKARRANIDLVMGKRVRIKTGGQVEDSHKRLLGYLFLPDGTFVNEVLLKNGYAFFYYHEKNREYKRRLLDAQRYAIKRNIGIWRRFLRQKGNLFTGNIKTKRLHLPSCRFSRSIAEYNRVYFKDVKDAYWRGFSPCRRCLNP